MKGKKRNHILIRISGPNAFHAVGYQPYTIQGTAPHAAEPSVQYWYQYRAYHPPAFEETRLSPVRAGEMRHRRKERHLCPIQPATRAKSASIIDVYKGPAMLMPEIFLEGALPCDGTQIWGLKHFSLLLAETPPRKEFLHPTFTLNLSVVSAQSAADRYFTRFRLFYLSPLPKSFPSPFTTAERFTRQ